MTCCFFGHKDTPQSIAEKLEKTIEDLIEDGADIFYVGNNGSFDRMVYGILKKLHKKYPHIRYNIVLAYMPREIKDSDINYNDTIYPDGLETVPPKFAIYHRNLWMIEQADTVITYIEHLWGGAARFYKIAAKKGKRTINLGGLR